MKIFTAILNFFRIRTSRQREISAHRSEGARKGWAKRKAKPKPEVPHDVQ